MTGRSRSSSTPGFARTAWRTPIGRPSRRVRPVKAVKVIEVEHVSLAEVTGSDALPVESITVPLDGNRKGFVFTIRRAARAQMEQVAFQALAQTLGNLVHPYPATLVVLPDHLDLRAYAVVG